MAGLIDDMNDFCDIAGVDETMRGTIRDARRDPAAAQVERRTQLYASKPGDKSLLEIMLDIGNRAWYAEHQHDAAMCGDCGAGVRVNSAGAVVCGSPARHA